MAVQSSLMRSVGYDATARRLEIEFSDGDVYLYENVPESIYKELISAASIGSYFTARIMRNIDFPCSGPL
jgi:hypothetical protein